MFADALAVMVVSCKAAADTDTAAFKAEAIGDTRFRAAEAKDGGAGVVIRAAAATANACALALTNGIAGTGAPE